jgi:hypothetical protein
MPSNTKCRSSFVEVLQELLRQAANAVFGLAVVAGDHVAAPASMTARLKAFRTPDSL